MTVEPSPEAVQFYKRTLPSSCIAFGSEEGKKFFTESLLSGHANIYFPLAEQFRTQNEPAYCGLSTLVMVLNALSVDPKRVWKGPWRWYHEEMLDCCLSLDVVQQEGITLEQFVCLAICNGLDLNVVRMNEKESVDDFRESVKQICSGSGKILTCSYSRKILGQTGDGHFSPIGAYNPANDMALILDVARFKYPPHWVKLDLLWESMKAKDSTTNLPRGYLVMRKSKEMPLLLFRLSSTFRVTIATHSLLTSHMAKFLKSWREFLKDTKDCAGVCNTMENAVDYALAALNEALATLLEGESVFTTQFNTCCTEVLPKQHLDGVEMLLKAVEATEIYRITDKWLQEFKVNNQPIKPTTCTDELQNAIKNCCRLDRVGVSNAQADDLMKRMDMRIQNDIIKAQCGETNDCGEGNLVTDSHYITMLLLSWPYHVESFSTYVTCLSKYIDDSLEKCHYILQNECNQLRLQIQSAIVMVKSHSDRS